MEPDAPCRFGMTDGIRAALAKAAARLADVSGTPRLDAELLMAHTLGISREGLLLGHMDDAPPAAFSALLARRLAYEPVAYITGTRDFWTIELHVTPDVLIPRPDSETLIEAAVESLPREGALRFLDLGTGSGALLLAALDQWLESTGVGVDCSAAALAVASENARRLGLGDRAAFVRCDWAQPLSGRFHGIFCNPPYIESTARLPRDVADYEPAGALFAGADGLDDYRRLIPQLPALLAPAGRAFLEIGSAHAGRVIEIAAAAGLEGTTRRDMAGLDRCIILQRL